MPEAPRTRTFGPDRHRPAPAVLRVRRGRSPRAGILVAFLGGLIFGLPLSAQHAATLLVPRGAVLLDAEGVFTQVDARFGPDGRSALGGGRFDAVLGSATFPGFAEEEARLRTLAEAPEASLDAGRVVGRFEMNDQRIPLRLGYGVLDRVTVGVTVPFVRRRIDAHLQLTGLGANVGRNPRTGGQGAAVSAFRSEARAALAALRTSVDGTCAEAGPEADACVQGRAAEARVAGFLDELDAAWEDLDLFPLAGSGLGSALAARWSRARADLADWGAEGPGNLPLARVADADDLARLRTRSVDAVWSPEGFPSTTPDAFYTLGDVEAHLVIGLVGHGPPSATDAGSDAGLRVRSAVEGTLRFATGTVDSFAVVTPMEALAGHAGFGVRWVTDLLAGDRAGLLVDLAWQSFTESEGIVRAVDPADGWNPSAARALGTGAPGDLLRVGVTPRFVIASGLSLGAGFSLVRSGESRWTFRPAPGGLPGAGSGDGPGDEPLPGELPMEHVAPGWTAQQAVLELRFAGWDAPVVDGLPFPAEVRVRALRSLAGSDDAPVETRLEMGVRLLRRR
jgi:hypothetical protein